MFNFPVVFVDIETTGGGYRSSRVLEVAAIRYENGEIVDEFTSLINPQERIPGFITGITGITQADIQDAPTFEDIAEQLKQVLEGAVFVAHNVNFDYSFIKSEYARIGVPFSKKKLCTVRLSRRLYAHEKGHSLEKIIQRHSIPFENRHRAYDDALALVHFTEIALREHGQELFSRAVTSQLKAQSVPVNLSDKDIAVIPEEPGVYIFKDLKGAVLYIGKSVNMRQRVMSHFRDMAAKEVKIAQQTTKIETIKTNSEVLALLLESRLVKQIQPIYNRQLRRVKNYCMVVKQDLSGYPTITYEYGIPGDQREITEIYGLYENKMKAKKWMDVITRTYDLCPKLMGLEKTNKSCFWYSLGKCKGACLGMEVPEKYATRFEIAMKDKKLEAWPYESEIEVPVDDQGSKLVIDKWVVKSIESDLPLFSDNANLTFDLDEYRIIRRFLKQNSFS